MEFRVKLIFFNIFKLRPGPRGLRLATTLESKSNHFCDHGFMIEINNWNYRCLQSKLIGISTIVSFATLNFETLNVRFELLDIIRMSVSKTKAWVHRLLATSRYFSQSNFDSYFDCNKHHTNRLCINRISSLAMPVDMGRRAPYHRNKNHVSIMGWNALRDYVELLKYLTKF